jgi:hypothetical protein
VVSAIGLGFFGTEAMVEGRAAKRQATTEFATPSLFWRVGCSYEICNKNTASLLTTQLSKNPANNIKTVR